MSDFHNQPFYDVVVIISCTYLILGTLQFNLFTVSYFYNVNIITMAPYMEQKIIISNNRKELSHQGKICNVHMSARSCPSDVCVFVSRRANSLLDTEAPTRSNDTTIRCELQLIPTVNWYLTPPRRIYKISNDLSPDIHRNHCRYYNDICLYTQHFCIKHIIIHWYIHDVTMCHIDISLHAYLCIVSNMSSMIYDPSRLRHTRPMLLNSTYSFLRSR